MKEGEFNFYSYGFAIKSQACMKLGFLNAIIQKLQLKAPFSIDRHII